MKKFKDWAKAVGLVVWSLIGIGIIICFIPTVSDKVASFMKLMPNNAIIAFLLLGIFFFVLWKFFKDKTGGYGLYTTSTLLITLTLMVTSIIFLFGGIESDDATKIILAAIGFAGGLFAGKDKK